VIDADGNSLLDVSGTEFNPLGYNHSELLKLTYSKEADSAIINTNLTTNERVGLDKFKLVNDVFTPLSPSGLSAVTFTRGGHAVEKAIMTAFAERTTGTGERFIALGFAGSNHGPKSSFLHNHF
jgi:4-aminobutyrate aminotransferase-like enzyme